MQFALTTNRGKVIKGGKELSNYIKATHGNYTVDINEENTLTTVKQCRDAYFFKVDLVVKHNGDERYDIHERFKKHSKIESTKEFSIVDWRNFIKQFQIYIFERLDIMV